MECFGLKSIGNSNDYMTIIREIDEGYIVQIVRDKDGYEDVSTDFMSKELFDSCIRTGYLTRISIDDKVAVNA